MGFIDLPELGNNDQNSLIWLYKLLIQPLKASNNESESESIELWNAEPNLVNEQDPSWKWDLTFKPGTRQLSQPIIHLCHHEWRIRWKKNNRTIEDTMVKKLDSYVCSLGSFMIVVELPEIPTDL